MILQNLNLYLADDDKDDCLLFKDALDELPVSAQLTTVHDGEQLMELLAKQPPHLPHVLFLDLNMPRKNGFECLSEIKFNDTLKNFPVVIFSTSFEQDVVNLLYKKEAHFYIRKPADFTQLKKVIHQALMLAADEETPPQPTKDQFVLKGDIEVEQS